MNPLNGYRSATIAIAIAATLALLWASAVLGPGVSEDSIGYLSTARSLAAGHGWYHWGGGPVILYPPGLSALLAPFPLVGIDPLVGGRYLNAVAYGLTLVVAGGWLMRQLESRALGLIALVAMATSAPLLMASGYVWTEATFTLVMMWALLQAQRYWRDGDKTSLLTFALWCALACVIRYAGVTLILLGGILVIAQLRFTLAQRLQHSVLFGALSVSLLVAWLARNWVVAHTFLGMSGRPETFLSPAQTLERAGRVMVNWIWPNSVGGQTLATIAGACLLLVAALAVWGAWRGRGTVDDPPAPIVMMLFCVIYPTFIVVVKMRVGNFEPRYLTPVLVPLFLVGAWFLDRALARLAAPRAGGRRLGVVLLAALALWLACYPAPGAASLLTFLRHNGWSGYTAGKWQQTEVYQKLSKWYRPGTLLSNSPHMVYLLTGTPAQQLPDRQALRSPDQKALLRQGILTRLKQGEDLYVIYVRHPWIENWHDQIVGPTLLNRVINLVPLWQAQDGSGLILQVSGIRNAPRNSLE